MNAVTFDTLRFARTLREKAKLSSEQAEGLADALAEAFQGDVATKNDVMSVKADLREAELRLEAKIEATKADIIRWMFGTVGFQTLIVLGAVIALARIVR